MTPNKDREALKAARQTHDRIAVALMKAARGHLREGMRLTRVLEAAPKGRQQ